MAKKPDPASQDRRWMPYAVLVALLAWAGLWGVIQLPITDASTAIFFVLLFIAITGTAMPPVAYLNARFGQVDSQRVHRVRFIRQSIWMGTFVVIAGWLQTRRILTVTLALILLAVLALTETFLITREAPPTSDERPF
jgi:hypothetical protein